MSATKVSIGHTFGPHLVYVHIQIQLPTFVLNVNKDHVHKLMSYLEL